MLFCFNSLFFSTEIVGTACISFNNEVVKGMRVKQSIKNMIEKTKRSIQWVIGAKNKPKYAGIHLLAEFWYAKKIEDEEELKKILVKAAKEANSTPLKVDVYSFSPQGITGVVLLAESHISIHSWPEYNYLAIDLFTCGDKSAPDKALKYLKKEFKPKRVEIKRVKRGMI